MVWGREADTRQLVYVGALSGEQKGLKCNCICASCETVLQAVNVGKDASYFLKPNARGKFFRHDHGQQKRGCLTAAARLAALTMFMQSQEIDLPAPSVRRDVTGVSGEIFAHTETGQRVRARITHRHWVNEQQARITLDNGKVILLTLVTGNKVTEGAGIDAVISIQVDDPDVASWPPEKLLCHAELIDKWVCWDRHWEHEALAEIAQMKANQQADECIDLDTGDGGPLPPELSALQRSESVLHHVLKSMLRDIGKIRVPGVSERVSREMPDGNTLIWEPTLSPMTLVLSDVRLEFRMGNQVPDVMCRATDESRQMPPFDLMVEVAVTHHVGDVKRAKIIASGIACLEIDTGLLKLSRRCSKTELRAAISRDAGNKRWIFHPELQRRVEKATRQLDEAGHQMQQAIKEAAQRDNWLASQPLGVVTKLYHEALKRTWKSRQFSASTTSVPGGGYMWTFDELVQAGHTHGLQLMDAEPLIERRGVLWCLTVIEWAVHKPGAPFDFRSMLQRVRSSASIRPFTGFLVEAAETCGVDGAATNPDVASLIAEVRQSVNAGEVAYARPRKYDSVIGVIFPRLAAHLNQDAGTLDWAQDIQRKKADEERRIEAQRREQDREKRAAAQLAMVQAEEKAFLEQAILEAAKNGWLEKNSLTQSIDQCQMHLKRKGAHLRMSIANPEVLVATAHRARGMGIALETWLRDRKPNSALQVKQLRALLEYAMLV